jgi:hypothetical protein
MYGCVTRVRNSIYGLDYRIEKFFLSAMITFHTCFFSVMVITVVCVNIDL